MSLQLVFPYFPGYPICALAQAAAEINLGFIYQYITLLLPMAFQNISITLENQRLILRQSITCS
jgi:hypothetical protein